jgi:alpha-amylase
VEPSASRLGSRGVTEGVEEMACVDGHRGFEVRLRWDRPATLWRLPVETVSLSEDGFERIYQSSCLLPHWTVALDPGEVFRVTLSLEVGRIP